VADGLRRVRIPADGMGLGSFPLEAEQENRNGCFPLRSCSVDLFWDWICVVADKRMNRGKAEEQEINGIAAKAENRE